MAANGRGDRGRVGCPTRRRFVSIVAGLLGCVVACPRVLRADALVGETWILAISSQQGSVAHSEALRGFREHVNPRVPSAPIVVHPALSEASSSGERLAEALRNRPTVILALGSLALQTAIRHVSPDTPIVATLVVSADDLRKASNTTGVMLEFPPELQFQLLKRILPGARVVGVLYNPAENQPRVTAAAQVATRLGLTLEARPVPSPRELPIALEDLGRRVDLLWSVPDSLVLNPQTAQQIILFSLRQRVPFVGLSAAWAKAGALYAPEWDYADLGAQCGQMAVLLLQGTPVSAIPPAAPRRFAYVVNRRTAAHLNLELPEAVLRGAREVF